MDFHNLCQRLDVDSLRAKLPPLPQLKLPKSLPKLRGRKIFRSSRNNNVGGSKSGPGEVAATTNASANATTSRSLHLPQQSQQFINRTPQRISTISSLMHEQQERMGPTSTYCSAGSLDDDYYAPERDGDRSSRPISPVKLPTSHTESGADPNAPLSLTQRLQRGYKSLSELRLKHLFAKQTVVRRDNIEVDRYVEQYEAELRSEAKAQARRDREIADNYDIRIKTLAKSRQNTMDEGDEEVDTPPPALKQRRSVAEHSGDESGMEEEATPPAARRKPVSSGIAASRFAKVRQPPLQMPLNEGLESSSPPAPPPRPSSSSYKQLLQRLPTSLTNLPTLNRSKDKQESAVESADEPPQPPPSAPDGATSKLGLRHNIKRLRKSIKRPLKLTTRSSSATQESGDEDQPNARSSVTLKTRLSRSTDQLQQRWRKSFKFSTEAADQSEGAGESTTGGTAYLERTFNKLNEKMHQLKFFQRHTNVGVASPPSRQGPKPNTVGHEPVEIDDEELAATYHHSDSEDDNDDDDSGQDVCAEEAFGQVEEPRPRNKPHPGTQHVSANASANPKREMAKLAQLQAKRSSTAWSSESLEEIPDEDYPRVLIHQEHSDAFESTLIIAVATAPPPIPPPPIPAAVGASTDWVPNEQIIAGFKEQMWPTPSLYKPKSIDIFEASGCGAAGAFADFDEVLRNAPVLRIINDNASNVEAVEEDEEDEEEDDSSSGLTRIRVHSSSPQIGNSRESLMEAQQEDEEDEDDEAEALDHIMKAVNHQESREKPLPDAERPPSTSPPPPPLPQRRPIQVPIIPPVPIYDAVPPPLPTSKPPPPPVATVAATAAAPTVAVPQRSASMSRPSKPLVKTSSLRLTYNEQVRPGDVGKVNKLISRFEGGRPRLCPRRLHSEEYTNNNNNNDVDNDAAAMDEEANTEPDASRTPTNRTPIPEIVTTQPIIETMQISSTQIQLNLDRQNSNCSRSEYGSPLAYPSSRRSSTPTVIGANATLAKLPPPSAAAAAAAAGGHSQATAAHLRQMRRSRRSMTRDDDNFYSFDSDEENSYYSISPSSSSRYVVEI